MRKLQAALIIFVLATISLSALTVWFYIHLQDLKAPNLHIADYTWEYSESDSFHYAVGVRAAIFNSGTETAHPTESLHIEIYNFDGTLMYQEDVYIGSVAGESCSIIRHSLDYYGDPPKNIIVSIS